MPVIGWWLVLVGVVFAAVWVGFVAFRYGLLPTLVWGAPYVPTHPELLKTMLELVQIKPTDRVVDLGSGDGRIVFAAAQAGAAKAMGYEIDGWQNHRARRRAKREKIQSVEFVTGSFWKAPLHDVDVVFLYALPPYMPALVKKLTTELKPGARVVSLMYDLPGWEITELRDSVRLYHRP